MSLDIVSLIILLRASVQQPHIQDIKEYFNMWKPEWFGMILLEHSCWENFSIFYKAHRSCFFTYCSWQDLYLDQRTREFAWYKLAHSKMILGMLHSVKWELLLNRGVLCAISTWCRQKKISSLCWRRIFWELHPSEMIASHLEIVIKRWMSSSSWIWNPLNTVPLLGGLLSWG